MSRMRWSLTILSFRFFLFCGDGRAGRRLRKVVCVFSRGSVDSTFELSCSPVAPVLRRNQGNEPDRLHFTPPLDLYTYA